MKKTVFVSAAALLLWSAARPQPVSPGDSLSLTQVIRLVIERNSLVAQSAKTADAALAAVDISRSSNYPDARAEVSYFRVGPVAEFDLGGGSIPLNPANNYDGHVSITQKLYDFDKTAKSVQAASSRATLETDHVEETKRDLAYASVRMFYSILFLEENIKVQDQQIHELNEYLGVAQRKLSAGTATEFDVLTTRVRIAAAQNQKIDLQNKLRQEQISLRRLADLGTDQSLVLRGTFQAETFNTNADTLLNAAKSRRVDLRAADDAVEAARRQVEVAGATSSPTLNLQLVYGVKNGFIPNLDVLRGNYAAGLILAVPIFDGFRTRSMEETAQANLQAAKERRRGTETQIRSEIQQALSDLRASSEKLETSKLTVEQAQRAIELARIKYSSGVVTTLDLLDAETALDQAKLSDLQALFGYVLSGYELKRAVGEQIW